MPRTNLNIIDRPTYGSAEENVNCSTIRTSSAERYKFLCESPSVQV